VEERESGRRSSRESGAWAGDCFDAPWAIHVGRGGAGAPERLARILAYWESHTARPLPARDRDRAPGPSADGCEAALLAEVAASAYDRDLARTRRLHPRHPASPSSCAWAPSAAEYARAAVPLGLTPGEGERAARSGRRDRRCCWDLSESWS